MVRNRKELNEALADFYRTYKALLAQAHPLEPDPEDIGFLLAYYHRMVAPYIASSEGYLLEVLNAWSRGEERTLDCVSFLQAETNEANGIPLGYLWGIQLEEKYLIPFAEWLSKANDYDRTLLPERLKPFWPKEAEPLPIS